MIKHPIYTNEESKFIDDYCHHTLNYPETTLMGMAAVSVFHANEDLWSTAEEIWIVCGTGGNGGDGYALAQILFQEGQNVRIFSLGEPKRKDSLFYSEQCINSGIPVHSFQDLEKWEEEKEADSILLVDAILGIGFTPPLKKEILSAIEWINSSDLFFYKLSLDTPSGFIATDPDSIFIEADSIEELGTRKWENLGYAVGDKIIPRYYESIGFPVRSLTEDLSFSHRFYWEKCNWEEIPDLIARKPNSYKYTSGSSVFFGGEEGMHGAIILSQSAFQNLGGGISKVFTPSGVTRDLILGSDPSRMVSLGDGMEMESDPIFSKTKTIVVGPGTKAYPGFLKHLKLREDQTLVLDAGAIPGSKETIPKGNVILTPHVGEFERLTGVKAPNIQEAYPVAVEFCKKNNVSLLYKSHISLFVTNTGTSYVWESPNPHLATMGTGDLLVGVLARFLSLGFENSEAMYYTLSFLEGVREMQEPYPTAGEILQFLVRKL
ncbi:NAD(P)H-hydrate epimerase [Leptospira ilyithenensis]|uniref:Bifunctional NAD(P)H-hydrate repair enzyme n=1 Tax=Leptospira ilyithenensis TaxID=2484901 RepID=A0A4R9LVT0_9LEPT|nr:NAD(P)H-hydrate epimerase [Leptospira ilyithenensis]TGN13996.1 NAD(P)H-hydrate epimerase [Leptospira ilyithenensis]